MYRSLFLKRKKKKKCWEVSRCVCAGIGMSPRHTCPETGMFVLEHGSRDSSVVEHWTPDRKVTGSTPGRKQEANFWQCPLLAPSVHGPQSGGVCVCVCVCVCVRMCVCT